MCSSTQTSATWKTAEQLMSDNTRLSSQSERDTCELQRVSDEKIKLKNENIRLKQQVSTFNEQSDMLHKNIRAKDDILENIKGSKTREVDLAKQVELLKRDNEARFSDAKKLNKQIEQLKEQEKALRGIIQERERTKDELEIEDGQDASSTEPVNINIGQMMKSIQQTIERRMTEMESKIETIVEKKWMRKCQQ